MRLPHWLGPVTKRSLPATSAAHAFAGYLVQSRLPGFSATLDERLTCLASAFAAELSGCRWCIEQSAHQARLAGVTPELLGQLSAYSRSPLLSQRERAALAVVDVVGRGKLAECGDPVLRQARQFFTEHELAEITVVAVERHGMESPNLSPT
jgi:AhpD family alkylhydroperoxidase